VSIRQHTSAYVSIRQHKVPDERHILLHDGRHAAAALELQQKKSREMERKNEKNEIKKYKIGTFFSVALKLQRKNGEKWREKK
jgi:hypothetical protein